MPKVSLLNQTGSSVGEIELNDAVFGIAPNSNVLFDAVVAQRASLRQGNHKVKNRSEVAGGGRKPWKQKGTGRARQGLGNLVPAVPDGNPGSGGCAPAIPGQWVPGHRRCHRSGGTRGRTGVCQGPCHPLPRRHGRCRVDQWLWRYPGRADVLSDRSEGTHRQEIRRPAHGATAGAGRPGPVIALRSRRQATFRILENPREWSAKVYRTTGWWQNTVKSAQHLCCNNVSWAPPRRPA